MINPLIIKRPLKGHVMNPIPSLEPELEHPN